MATISPLNHILRLNRIDHVLDYIKDHIAEPLSVERLAQESCWSRWQLQRVFLTETGLTVAQYVRHLRLSMAAELLLTTAERHLDISFNCGFESEISFSRSFKKFFSCSPGQYRKNGQHTGLLMPITRQSQASPAFDALSKLIKIRIETKPCFDFLGLNCEINGIFSVSPDFGEKIPLVWQQLKAVIQDNLVDTKEYFGIVDLVQADPHANNIPYWAGFESRFAPQVSGLKKIHIPAQLYAVIDYTGSIDGLPKVLEWFISHWLPNSNYSCIESFELEYYGPDFDLHSDHAQMEYWLPVVHTPLRVKSILTT